MNKQMTVEKKAHIGLGLFLKIYSGHGDRSDEEAMVIIMRDLSVIRPEIAQAMDRLAAINNLSPTQQNRMGRDSVLNIGKLISTLYELAKDNE